MTFVIAFRGCPSLAVPTLVLGAEATLPVVAIRCEVQPQPVLAADDRGWETGSGKPGWTGHREVRSKRGHQGVYPPSVPLSSSRGSVWLETFQGKLLPSSPIPLIHQMLWA